MTARLGKIAQLPKSIRDELNQRLSNGALGPQLLAWLSELPEVRELLAKSFNSVPISPQNLSEWRHGGYQDWLHHQEREWRIQRVAEEGDGLKRREGEEDFFENFARMAAAEMLADFDSLHRLKGEKRRKCLRGLTLDLSRLQNAYNRSRWALLAWNKWNDRFLKMEHYQLDPKFEKKDSLPRTTAAGKSNDVIPSEPTALKPDQAKSNGGGVEAHA